MHQFVQSAIEAAKQGDNQKAVAFIKQVLNSNPNDVDAWLVLAAVVDDPQRKRQCLNRVLKLDPVNMMAREELEEMDRAEMGGDMPPFISDTSSHTPPFASSLQEEPAPVSTPLYQPEPSSSFYSTGTSAFEPEEAPPPPPPAQTKPQAQKPARKTAKKAPEKTLVFKYPLFWRIVMYAAVVVFGCIGALIALGNVINSLLFFGLSFLMLITALVLSPTVEISEKGIRASGFLSSSEAAWDEIVKMKSNAMKRRLELTKRNKQVVNVSTQVSGYPQIVDILQKKRPDLFGMAPLPQAQTSAFSSENVVVPSYRSSASPAPAVPAFKGSRTFKKSFFRQYGSYLIVIPFCLVAAWTVLYDPQYRIGAGISVVFCLIMLVLPLFQVSSVKLELNKLTIETLFEQKVFSAKEISEIKIQTVRGKYGRATNYINILPFKGKNYPLEGFSDGDEIIYGVLTNWWNAGRGA